MRYFKLKRAQMVNLGAGLDPARGECFEGVKIGFCQETKHSSDAFCHDFKFTANNEKTQGDTDLLVQGSAHAGRMV